MGAGQEDDSRVWVNGGQVYGKGQGIEEEASTERHHGRKRRFQRYKEEKMAITER